MATFHLAGWLIVAWALALASATSTRSIARDDPIPNSGIPRGIRPANWGRLASSRTAQTRVGRTTLKEGEPENPANRKYPVKKFETVGQLSPHSTLPQRVSAHGCSFELAALCEQEGLKVGVEIGVWQGAFASHNLQSWPSVEKYYLVDAWTNEQEHYIDIAKGSHDTNLERAKRAVEPWKDKVRIIRGFSVPSAKKVPDNSVDMIYIDARHDYWGVHEDIEAWWPKLRKNGIMAGHDFLDSTHAVYYLRRREGGRAWMTNIDDGTLRTDGKAVYSAVAEFAEANNRTISTTSWTTDRGFRTWMIRK